MEYVNSIKKPHVLIAGGGNIGSAIAHTITKRNVGYVTVCTSRPEQFSKYLKGIDGNTGEESIVELYGVTADLREAAGKADVILITYPSFLLRDALTDISQEIKDGTYVGIVPGIGGAEFYAQSILPKNVIFFGLDRVPCVSRLIDYGKHVSYFPKKQTRIAALPGANTETVCALCSRLLDMQCVPLKSYFTVTCTPSNPIIHTARLYDMFKDYDGTQLMSANFRFYDEWTLGASEFMLALDDELTGITDAYADIPSEIVPLRIHYESADAQAMTDKLRSIESLANIMAPMKETPLGFAPDLNCRYFIEDIPYGLYILRDFASIASVPTPAIERAINWFERIETSFNSQRYPDVMALRFETVKPSDFGLTKIEDVVRFYGA